MKTKSKIWRVIISSVLVNDCYDTLIQGFHVIILYCHTDLHLLNILIVFPIKEMISDNLIKKIDCEMMIRKNNELSTFYSAVSTFCSPFAFCNPYTFITRGKQAMAPCLWLEFKGPRLIRYFSISYISRHFLTNA